MKVCLALVLCVVGRASAAFSVGNCVRLKYGKSTKCFTAERQPALEDFVEAFCLNEEGNCDGQIRQIIPVKDSNSQMCLVEFPSRQRLWVATNFLTRLGVLGRAPARPANAWSAGGMQKKTAPKLSAIMASQTPGPAEYNQRLSEKVYRSGVDQHQRTIAAQMNQAQPPVLLPNMSPAERERRLAKAINGRKPNRRIENEPRQFRAACGGDQGRKYCANKAMSCTSGGLYRKAAINRKGPQAGNCGQADGWARRHELDKYNI